MNDKKFEIWMVVYEKDSNRLENFYYINSLIKCKKFSAIDTINNNKFYSELAIKKNYTTNKYLNSKEVKMYPGKLGCNLSHQILLDNILNVNSFNNWYLILEDDVYIKKWNIDEINNILKIADDNNSDYIQLYTHPKFLSKQNLQKKIYSGLYKMISQYGTLAYFINKRGIKKVLEQFPINKNIDEFYSSKIKDLNSLCWINNIFESEGNLDPHIKKKLGSLIWKIK